MSPTEHSDALMRAQRALEAAEDEYVMVNTKIDPETEAEVIRSIVAAEAEVARLEALFPPTPEDEIPY